MIPRGLVSGEGRRAGTEANEPTAMGAILRRGLIFHAARYEPRVRPGLNVWDGTMTPGIGGQHPEVEMGPDRIRTFAAHRAREFRLDAVLGPPIGLRIHCLSHGLEPL